MATSGLSRNVCTANASNANYGYYADPKFGYADLPTIVGGMDPTFGNGSVAGGMSARNAFRGPGTYSRSNADVVKKFKFHDRYGLQLRA